jgi:hypothetical protein
LSASSVTWNAGSTLMLQLGASSADELALSGALTMGTGTGSFTLDLVNAGITTQSSYILATFASTTFAATDFTLILPSGFTGTLVETSTSLEIDNLITHGQSGHTEDTQLSDASVSSDAITPTSDSLSSPASDSFSTPANLAPTPEPGSAVLLAFGGCALLGWRRKRRP